MPSKKDSRRYYLHQRIKSFTQLSLVDKVGIVFITPALWEQ